MNVNARGDILDSANRVVEPKNKQLQKHYSRQVSNTTTEIPTAGGVPSKKKQKAAKVKVQKQPDEIPEIPEIESMEELAALEETMPDIVAEPTPVQVETVVEEPVKKETKSEFPIDKPKKKRKYYPKKKKQ